MPQKNIDDLLGLFDQTKNYFDQPVDPLQPIIPELRKVKDYDSDKSVDVNYSPIIDVGGAPATEEARFVRQNKNILANQALEKSQQLEDESEHAKLAQLRAMQKQEGLADQSVSMAQRYMSQERRKPGDYSGLQSRIESMMDSAEKPQQDDLATQLITAFGPGLMGMALGGSSGYEAAKPAHEFGYALSEQRKKDALASSKSRRETSALALEALGKLRGEEAKGIAEYDKSELERMKFMVSTMEKAGASAKDQADFVQKWAQGSQKDSMAIFEKYLEGAGKGVDETVKQDQNQKDRDSRERIAKDMAKAASARITKPTDGERKASTSFGLLQNAENTYQNFKKEMGGNLPSQKHKFKNFYASLSQLSNPGSILMGEVIRKQQDPKLRRQIEIESQWLAPKLRKDSGAAISVGEYLMERPIYFGDADNKEVESQKETARKQYMLGVKGESGNAPLPQILTGVNPDKKQPALKDNQKMINGVLFEKAEGGWKKVK